MPPALRPLRHTAALVLLIALVAACSSPTIPSFSSDQTSQALTEGQEDVQAAVTSFEGSEAGQAVTAITGSTSTSFGLSRLTHDGTYGLDRHTYSYDPSTYSWIDNGTGDNLEYHWEYGSTSKIATLVIDWAANEPTLWVTPAYMTSDVEVPQGPSATLTANGTVVGEATAAFDYFSSTACGTTDEITGFAANGYLGTTGDRITVQADYALGTDSMTTTGELDLVSGAHQAGFSWSLDAAGSVSRIDCGHGSLESTSGNGSVAVYAGDSSASLSGSYDNVSADGTFDINGSLRLNGRLAVAFAGNMNDADMDGVPGDNVTLTFAQGETMTLEQYISNEYQQVTTALRALNTLK